jgi:hypothetical protein
VALQSVGFMFFRFGAAILLAVLVAMCGVLLEKRTLNLRRDVTRQYYRTDVLLESYARLRLRTQQLAAPTRVIEAIEDEIYVEPIGRRTNLPPLSKKPKPLPLLRIEPGDSSTTADNR